MNRAGRSDSDGDPLRSADNDGGCLCLFGEVSGNQLYSSANVQMRCGGGLAGLDCPGMGVDLFLGGGLWHWGPIKTVVSLFVLSIRMKKADAG